MDPTILLSAEGGRSVLLRNEMIRKRFLLAFALGFLLVLLFAVSAMAADDPLKVSMELSNNKFSKPETIKVSITVSNVGEGDMPSPVTLYYPNDKQVEEFGSPTLAVGVSKNWSGSWKVTQQELEAGKITFKIRYSVYNDEGQLLNKTKNFSKKIIYSGAAPELSVHRTIVPTVAQKGQDVSVTYDIENTGASDVTAVTIKENSSVSPKSGTIDRIPAGETGKYTFTATMGTRDLTSAATISYKSGGKTYTTKVEAATIKYGVVNLSASLSADKKGGAPGDTVKLTLTLKNSGNVNFTGVTVTDEALGTVFSDETVPAGETVKLEKELTITETQDLQFSVTAQDETGQPVETATGRVSILATDPTQQIVLSVDASPDRDVVYKIPGTVRFTVNVHNESAVDVKNITVRAVETAVYVFESIPAGETRSFSRDMDVSMPGSFQFVASCRDQLDQTLRFSSNVIPISYAEPTPVPTEAPLVTPPAPVTEPIPEDLHVPDWLNQVEEIAASVKWILAGIGGCLLVLLLIGAVRRGRSRSQSRKAMDHLEGANYRDYSTAPRGGKRNEVTDNFRDTPESADASDENPVQDSELMAETLKRLYTDQPEQKAAEADAGPGNEGQSAETAPAPGQEAPAEPAPQAEASGSAEAQPQAAVEAAHRRRSRK